MSRCFIDEEQNPYLDTDEDCKFHIDTVQDQRSMSDAPVLKQASDVELKDTCLC